MSSFDQTSLKKQLFKELTSYYEKYWLRNIPKTGDFIFLNRNLLHTIVSNNNSIQLIYPHFGTEIKYEINSSNRYIVWKDILSILDSSEGKIFDSRMNIFIEDIKPLGKYQYQLLCNC